MRFIVTVGRHHCSFKRKRGNTTTSSYAHGVGTNMAKSFSEAEQAETTPDFQRHRNQRQQKEILLYHICSSPPHFQFDSFLHSDRHLSWFAVFFLSINTTAIEVTTIDVSPMYNRARGTEAAFSKRFHWLGER